jgi:hypothetical protein
VTSAVQSQVLSALRRAAVRATYAPSVHNTQPWKFVLYPDGLEVYADRSRQLSVLDPTGRQLILSCGCALFNAQVALAAAEYQATIDRFPDPARPDLLARITVSGPTNKQPELAHLDGVITLRQTNRRRFSDDPVPDEVVAELVAAASAHGASLIPITRFERRVATAILSQLADRQQNADPAYRAELRAWTSTNASRTDGVPSTAVPHVDGTAHDDVPIRDFDSSGDGFLPSRTRSSMFQCLLLVATPDDTPEAWLRAGEALERVLLNIAMHGLAASPLTQVVEVAWTRERLRQELETQMHPLVLLRVGRAPAAPGTRRRRLVDVLREVS